MKLWEKIKIYCHSRDHDCMNCIFHKSGSPNCWIEHRYFGSPYDWSPGMRPSTSELKRCTQFICLHTVKKEELKN
jgi:hypothetical protein